jgi:RNase adapter protein RapZ
MKVIIITGLSGAGKTQAVNFLEDFGYYCIDNMPPALIKNFIDLVLSEQSDIKKAAFVVDIRGGEFFGDLQSAIDQLKESQTDYKVLFLDTTDDILVQRFSETRRVHPMTGKATTLETLAKEREMLEDIKKSADYIIDTSRMKAADLKNKLNEIFSSERTMNTFVINIISFGFKKGIPLTADMVMDVRFLPNPFYVKSLKKLTGNSKKVKAFVLKQEESIEYINRVVEMVEDIIPSFEREGKNHLNLALGCTGGQHRSVVVANEIAKIFRDRGRIVTLEHRESKKVL